MELRPYQKELIESVRQAFMSGHNSVVMQLATGGGKCLGKGTPVLIFDGTIKNVEDVSCGDLLMGPDSQSRRVVSVCTGEENLYKVIPNKGDCFVVNESHILSLVKTPQDSNPKYPSDFGGDIVNISVREYLKKSFTFKHIHKGWRTGVEFNSNFNNKILDPYFLGLWLGDGSSGSASITTDDIEILYYLEDKCKNVLGVPLTYIKNKDRTQTVSLSYGVHKTGLGRYKNPILNELRKYNLINNKHIPHEYKTASRNNRLLLLAGLMDSDGYAHRNGFDYISSIKQLAEDVAYLARSLGFSAYVKKCNKTCYNNGKVGTYYRVSIGGDCNQVPVILERKKPHVRLQKKNHLRFGFKLEYIGKGQYFGFELEGNDKLFLLGDFTVTHNTASVINMIHRAFQKGNKSWFLCHRQELVNQASKTMDALGVPHGVLAAGHIPMIHRHVQVCSIQTLARRLEHIRNFPQLVVIDESHHSGAAGWTKVINFLVNKGAKVIGLTATPTRLDGKGLDQHFTAMVCGPQTDWLIEQGYLSPFKCYAPSRVNLEGVKTVAGDYAKDQLAAVMDKPNITGDLIHHYQTITPNKKAIVFAVKVEHSQHIAEAFNAVGVRAEHVDGETPKDKRQEVIKAFARGEVRVLSNVDLFGEGFDIPDAEVAILARPTQSLSLHLQQVGRVLRPVYAKGMPLDTAEQRRAAIAAGPKPFAYILDHASNNIVHGLPDEVREWTLQGQEKRGGKKKKEDKLKVRQCPKCYYVQKIELDICGSCGHVFEKKGRNVEQVDGELRELTREDKIKLAQERAKQAKREQASAHSLEQLIQLGRSRGYKQPEAWARYVFKGRQRA